MDAPILVYWDTSAIVSALLQDAHTDEAQTWLRLEGAHLASSLAAAELYAGLSRLGREGIDTRTLTTAAGNFEDGWLLTTASPDPRTLFELSKRWPLRGADLWHLGLAACLRAERADLVMLTFDEDLRQAAAAEGLTTGA